MDQGPVGLVTVTLPEDSDGGQVVIDWAPPGYTVSLGAAAVGLVLTAGLVVIDVRRRSRRRPPPGPAITSTEEAT